jgi:hypothetical protein
MTGAAGLWIGIAVGFLSAVISQFYVLDTFKAPDPNPGWWSRTFGSNQAFAKTAAKLMSLPAFWFGDSALASTMHIIDWKTEIPSYAAGVAFAYCILFGPIYLRLTIRTWNAIGK